MQNQAFQDPNISYYVQEKKFLIDLVPSGRNAVMDLGCASGRLGKGLIEANKAHEMTGVEIFASAAEEARKFYKTVHVGDIEEMDLSYTRYFDVVICGDVLEHLKEPEKVVKRIHTWLKDDGRLICCVPNVRYWKVWRDLVFKGKWDYTNDGIMDQTHLRFFTTNSFAKLLDNAGFAVEKKDMRIHWGPKQLAFNRLTGGVFKEFLGFQMLFTARKIK